MDQIITENSFQANKPIERPAVVKFVNFSKTPFTWTWNKIPYTFLPGEKNAKFMERSIAIHFAKHLVNRELLARGREADTSPKNPQENPFFMDLFNRCIIEIKSENGPVDQTKLEQEAIDKNMKHTLGIKPSKAKDVSPEEIKSATGQHVRKDITNKPASDDDKDFEEIEVPDDGDE